jgi:hypothetical protein
MAEMAALLMKSKSLSKKAKIAERQTPHTAIMPFGIGLELIGSFCLPDEFILSNPIMPDGFITYTDLMPSSDVEG